MALLYFLFMLFPISWSQTPAPVSAKAQVINEVLFELNNEAWTSFDYQQFLKAKSKVSLDASFLKQAQDNAELFLLTRILFYQVITTSMNSSESTHFNAFKKYQSQNDSLNAEIERLKMILESGTSKFQQLVSAERYQLWLSYMKKKYNYANQ